MFAFIFRTFWSKMAGFGGKIGEGVVRCWSPTNSFLLLGIVPSLCHFWWKSIKKCDRESAGRHRQADRRTHALTETNWIIFIICPMLYAIGMGQIITLNSCFLLRLCLFFKVTIATSEWCDRQTGNNAKLTVSYVRTLWRHVGSGESRQLFTVTTSMGSYRIIELSTWNHSTAGPQ